ncbi:hypothetical protein [Symmachiella macrocystis]|uniref:hypothetical protein n=1 Tax=Symmachiella macrocystis TaxID=2527985 RepID=UPI0011B60E78|nr:hypothetical protein [Symmachiella macrocystis]
MAKFVINGTNEAMEIVLFSITGNTSGCVFPFIFKRKELVVTVFLSGKSDQDYPKADLFSNPY